MTKDEHIAKLREALEKYGCHTPECNGTLASSDIPCDCGFEAALASLPSSSEPPQPGEITDEMIDKAWLEWWDNPSISRSVPSRKIFAAGYRAALQAALGAKP